MRLHQAELAFTFDDFVLEPQESLVESRKDPDITVPNATFPFKSPVFSAPMSTITELEMAQSMLKCGAGAVVHRYMPISKQISIAEQLDLNYNYFFAIGTGSDARERMSALYSTGVRNICIDVANGHNIHCWRMITTIKEKYPNVRIMAGNVCTFDGAKRLAKSGADLIRVGIGSGAVCTTRIVTGHGSPQLSAIESCSAVKDKSYMNISQDIVIIADGGIRSSGDVVKALAIGADMVMIGSILAGSQETPGEIIEEDNRLYKYYQGMASEKARANWFDKSKSGLPVEGISTKVPYIGRSAIEIVQGLCQSIRVGLAYSGAESISELQAKAKWRRITTAGYVEGTPHGRRQ